MENINVELVGYKFTGTTKIGDWNGNVGWVDMTDVYSDKDIKKKEFGEHYLNDGKFGADKMFNAKVNKYKILKVLATDEKGHPTSTTVELFMNKYNFNEKDCTKFNEGI